MTSSQYYNIICGTLCNMTEDEREDSASVAKKVFDNCGEAFPSGNCAAVFYALKSNDYVSWRSCTAEEAQQYANQGIPTVAMDEKQATIIRPEEAALLVKNPSYAVNSSLQSMVESLDMEKNGTKLEFFVANASPRKWPIAFAKSTGMLTISQQKSNAEYIYYSWLRGSGFTKEAACGILGNIQKECTMNPGAWQVQNNMEYGYGLFQWSAARKKYLKWVQEKGFIIIPAGKDESYVPTLINGKADTSPEALMDSEMDFFLFSCTTSSTYREWYKPSEVKNAKNHTSIEMDFYQYKQSKEPVSIMALIFHDHYERGGDSASGIQKRQKYAEDWYAYLEG